MGHPIIRRSQGEVQFGWFQWEIKLPKAERLLCHEARHWIYRSSENWSQALNGLMELRQKQVSTQNGLSSDRDLFLLEKYSRIISLSEFIKYDEKLRTTARERDEEKKRKNKLRRTNQEESCEEYEKGKLISLRDVGRNQLEALV